MHRDGRLRGEQRVDVPQIEQRISVSKQIEQPQVGPSRGDDPRGGGGERGDEQDHSILNVSRRDSSNVIYYYIYFPRGGF